MSWIYYLLEANLYFLLFYAFYRLLLHKETFYTLNRYYLVLSTIIAFMLPFLQASYFRDVNVVTGFFKTTPPAPVLTKQAFILVPLEDPAFDFTSLLPYLYLCITIIFLVKMAISIMGILRMIDFKKEKFGNVTYVTLKETDEKAFSFFNLLFINPKLEGKQTVISHELVHIKQKHSLDIIFFEVVQAICWFNPISWFIKSDIKLLHEYLADERTTAFSNNKHEYAMFLIRNSFGIPSNEITNHIFNQSILKRRINMLNKERTTGKARLRLLLLLPLGGTMLCLSTMAFTKDYGLIDLYPEKYSAAIMMQEPPPTVKKTPPSQKVDFFAEFSTDPNTKKRIAKEKRLIIVNGKKMDNNEIGAIYSADKMVKLQPADAVKKYGDAARYGALEFTGKNIRVASPVEPPPPAPKKAVVKFPPPDVRPDYPNNFYFGWKYDKETQKQYRTDKRLVVVNGTKFSDDNALRRNIAGFRNAKSIVYLSAEDAQKKYGDQGKFGAVEVTGDKISLIKLSPPPPTVKGDVTKFPPPIVKGDVTKFPPPIVKKDVKKFPPPRVKPDTLTVKKVPVNLKLKKTIEIKLKSPDTLKLTESH